MNKESTEAIACGDSMMRGLMNNPVTSRSLNGENYHSSFVAIVDRRFIDRNVS
jgi:hypothetical protein